MPDNSRHLDQYKHNKKLLTSTELDKDKTSFPDWVIIVAFYSAVHLIEKELASIPFHSSTHKNRDEIIVKIPKLKPIATQYATLEMQSKKARYECITLKNKHANDAIELLREIEKIAL